MTPMKSGSAFATLAADVAAGARDLAEAHVEQLKAEIRHESTRAVSGGVSLAAGAALAVIGVIFALVAVVMLLVDRFGFSPAAAWALVGVVLGLGGLIVARIGQQQLTAVRVVPQHTMQSLRESLSWITRR